MDRLNLNKPINVGRKDVLLIEDRLGSDAALADDNEISTSIRGINFFVESQQLAEIRTKYQEAHTVGIWQLMVHNHLIDLEPQAPTLYSLPGQNSVYYLRVEPTSTEENDEKRIYSALSVEQAKAPAELRAGVEDRNIHRLDFELDKLSLPSKTLITRQERAREERQIKLSQQFRGGVAFVAVMIVGLLIGVGLNMRDSYRYQQQLALEEELSRVKSELLALELRKKEPGRNYEIPLLRMVELLLVNNEIITDPMDESRRYTFSSSPVLVRVPSEVVMPLSDRWDWASQVISNADGSATYAIESGVLSK